MTSKKCREAYRRWCDWHRLHPPKKDPFSLPRPWNYFQAGWKAALKSQIKVKKNDDK